MKQGRIILILILIGMQFCYGQVGVNTTSPNAQLDIRSSNQATPNATDGILIPKVDTFPTGVNANQDAMLIYLTTTVGSNVPGFYYYNHGTTSWLPIGNGARSINELSDGKSDTDGTDDGSSIYLGINAGINDDETNNANIGIGFSSLENNTIGGALTAIGYQSLQNNTTGNWNSAFGHRALEANTTGTSNSAFGYLALQNNTTGSGNISLGNRSLLNNIDGEQNVAIGSATMFNNASGNSNVAVGNGALLSNTTGNFNVAIGREALYFATEASYNTGIGAFSLLNNTTGDLNTALGSLSLLVNTIGSNNTAMGFLSLASNTSGQNNVAVGNYALSSNQTGSNNIAIGYYAGFAETGSNKLFIENSTSTPLIYGEFDNDFLQINGTLNINGAYSFPQNDGNANEVLVNNGSGGLTWRNFSDVDDDSINNLSDGKTNPGNNSIFLGQSAGQNDSGSTLYNIGIGLNALRDNTAGEENVGIGYSALLNNTSGSGNTAIGTGSLLYNQTGIENTAVGGGALSDNTIASGNTAVGHQSLASNTEGEQNTAIGVSSLGSNTTGFSNIAVGALALWANETGIGNTALGSTALFSNISGNSNIAIGYGALHSSQLGSSNIAVGFEALYSNLNNGNNIGIGSEALRNNSGVNNTVIGHNAGRDSGIGSYNVFIGNEAGLSESGNNKLYIENSNANANNALIYGDFDINFLRLNAVTEINGRTEITATTDANGTAGSGVVEIGGSLRIDGNEIITNTNSPMFLQSDNNGDLEMDGGTFRMDASTNRVGINTNNPQSTLHINGEVRIGDETIADAGNDALRINAALIPEFDDTNVIGNPTQRWRTVYAVNGTINTSDKREKKNIKPIDYGLEELLKLNPISFNWKNDNNPDIKLGLIAQELKEIIPEVVNSHYYEKDQITGKLIKMQQERLGVYYSDLIPVLIKAIQEQQNEIQNLINELETEKINKLRLESRVEKIEMILNQ